MPSANGICICITFCKHHLHLLSQYQMLTTWKTVNLSWAVCLQPNFNWLCWAHMQHRSKLNRSVCITNILVNAHSAKHPWQGFFKGHCILLLMTVRLSLCMGLHNRTMCCNSMQSSTTLWQIPPPAPTCYRMQRHTSIAHSVGAISFSHGAYRHPLQRFTSGLPGCVCVSFVVYACDIV